MNDLIVLGLTFLFGLLGSLAIRRVHLPQVVAQMCLGILLGVSGLKLFNPVNLEHFEILPKIALGIIGFSIGGELRFARIKKFGKTIFLITCFESVFAVLFAFLGIYLITNSLPIALIIGSLAAATAPGGTTQVIQEYRARGPLTTTLFGVIGADDAFAIFLYSIAYNIGKTLLITSDTSNHLAILHTAGVEVGLALLLGLGLGLFFLLFIKVFKDDDTKQLFSLSAVLLCSGLAHVLGSSEILANMTMGIVVANRNPLLARSYFSALYKLTPPIYILFFVLVGARLDITLLPKIGLIGVAYLVLRSFGKISGAWFGGKLANAPEKVQKYLGFCLLSQAGVAIGLAISTQQELSKLSTITLNGVIMSGNELGLLILNIITATTLIFQIGGPILAKYGLKKAGEIRE